MRSMARPGDLAEPLNSHWRSLRQSNPFEKQSSASTSARRCVEPRPPIWQQAGLRTRQLHILTRFAIRVSNDRILAKR